MPEHQIHARALVESLVGLDRLELIAAARRLVETYHALAPGAAAHHGLEVPLELAGVAEAKLEELIRRIPSG